LVPQKKAVFWLPTNSSSSASASLKDCGLVLFELDQQAVQAHKREYLAAAGIDASYDPAKKSIFLWEGRIQTRPPSMGPRLPSTLSPRTLPLLWSMTFIMISTPLFTI